MSQAHTSAALAQKVDTQVKALKSAGDDVVSRLSDNNAVVDQNLKTAVGTLVTANADVLARAEEIIKTVVGDISAVTSTGLFDPTTHPPVQMLLAMLFDRTAGQFQDVAGTLLDAMAPFVQQDHYREISSPFTTDLSIGRNKLYANVVGMGSTVGPVATQVANALLAPGDSNRDTDQRRPRKSEERARQDPDGTLAPAGKRDALIALFNLIKSWGGPQYEDRQNPLNGPNAVLFIANQAKDVVAGLVRDVLKGDLGKIIDFAAIKADVERRLRDLIPSKVTLAYDFDTELQNVLDIFIPEPGSRLTLKARTVIDVLNGGSPQVSCVR